jgi:hypothetical protein
LRIIPMPKYVIPTEPIRGDEHFVRLSHVARSVPCSPETLKLWSRNGFAPPLLTIGPKLQGMTGADAVKLLRGQWAKTSRAA